MTMPLVFLIVLAIVTIILQRAYTTSKILITVTTCKNFLNFTWNINYCIKIQVSKYAGM